MNTSEQTVFERRNRRRFAVEIPLHCAGTWTRTINVSSSGVRFEWGQVVAPGTAVNFDLCFDELAWEAIARCAGTVVRTEWNGGKHYIAATIDSIGFEPFQAMKPVPFKSNNLVNEEKDNA
jgi:hypothetical protein